MSAVERAYSLIHLKSVDSERRVITGLATTPETDRMGDIVESKGATFRNPVVLLLHHDSRLPVGTATFGRATDAGIPFEASFPDIDEPGALKDRVTEAWQSVKSKLIRGVSIGFRVLDDGIELMKTGGYRFTKTEILELSLVAVPANASATIQTVKSLDSAVRAASGVAVDSQPNQSAPGVTGRRVSLARKGATSMKNIAERKQAFAAEKAAKVAKMNELMGADEGTTMDAETQTAFDTLSDEIKSIDDHMARLETLEQVNKASAVPVAGRTEREGSQSRAGAAPVITVKESLPPGIAFARAVLCKTAAFMTQGSVSPVEIARQRYPSSDRLQAYLTKATVPAGTTTDSTWAGNLVDPSNLESEFIEFLRPMTVIGKFGQGGIPSLRRVPFNVRITSQTTGGNAWWVGQGAPKPVTSFGTGVTTLTWAKVAAISVITEELARFSSPSAESMVRDQLAAAIVDQLDRDFVDPSTAAVSNVSPASITNGLTALSSAGTSADNVRTDLQNLLETFILQNINPSQLVLIMPNTLALAASLMVNSLGQDEFPGLTMNGGTLRGIPVITSQHAANQSGAGNLVIAVNASDIFLSDDGQVSVDASREASIQMLDNPTNNSSTGTPTTVVSMWQTNSIALRAERYINWARRRDGAVAYIDDANWGSIGSPS